MPIQRIKISELQSMVDLINRLAGTPLHSHRVVDGTPVPQAGNYHIESGDRGGYRLVQISASGQLKDVLNTGYIRKRELFNAICDFRNTLSTNKAIYQSLTFL